MTDHNEWFIHEFDRTVAESGDGNELAKSRDDVAHAYATAVEAGDLEAWRDDLVEQGRDLFDRFVKPERTARRNAFTRELEVLIDALNGDTILGRDDPRFAQAIPIGDGRDKRLGAWSPEDWLTATTTRTRNSESVATATREFAEKSTVVVSAMFQAQVRATEDLFNA